MYRELDIVEGCKAGKKEFQKELYRLFSRKMYNVCLRYSDNREEAEDILQEGFIKVFNNIDQYKGSGSFEGWICKIMKNSALEALRKKKFFQSGNVEYLEDTYQSDYDAHSKMSLKELLLTIQELPEGYKSVFNLYAINGYKHREIALMLNISESTSKSQFLRARNLLRNKLKNQAFSYSASPKLYVA